MKPFTATSVLLITLLTLTGAQAAEAPEGAATEANTPKEADASGTEAPAASEAPAPEPEPETDVFVPSVEVSEDRSVPFPVDI